MLIFNAPINMPPANRLHENEDCLPAGDVDVRVDTAGPPWQIESDIATIARDYFCPDDPAPTDNPNQSPTPAPNGDVNVNLQLEGTWNSNFNEFQATARMCDFDESGDVDWESCGEGSNKSSSTDITRKSTGTSINKTVTLNIADTQGGPKALVIIYDYKRTDGKIDNTGIQVEVVNNTECGPSEVDFGAYVCGVDAGGAPLNTSFKLVLPTHNATAYELRLGREVNEFREIIEPCTHAIDTNNKNGTAAQGERGQCSSYAEGNTIKVAFHNRESTEQKIYWLLGRCNGTFDDNEGYCETNAPVETTNLVQNIFDAEQTLTLPAGQVAVCTFDKSKYPTTENEANVRSSGAVSCVTAAPTATPVHTLTPSPTATSTPTPTPVRATTPNPGTGTPVPDADAGYYTSIFVL
ncbi:MAG: hypothetical protein UZ22_OP11002000416 [Microgenomates bacterium OLB23]|nr:MAG: hypothetical protein UZ22_OP11002000416 [Microgenomates bacterium OLB23]